MGSSSYHVGQRIKKYRKSRGYTIEQFSAMINKSKATVSKYENGTITIDVETGRLLCEPQIISRGFVYMRESEELIAETVALLTEEARRFEGAHKSDYANIKNSIRTRLKSHLKSKTKRTPMLLPISTTRSYRR